jgi:hypothetical protein
MMGQRDIDPIPPHAVTMWLTDHDIIAALPMTAGGTPYLMKLPLNEGGLLRALELLRKRRHEVLSPSEAASTFAPPTHQPQVKLSKASEKLHAETTPEQRANALALIQRLGLKR